MSMDTWCRLGNDAQIQNSEIGVNGSIIGTPTYQQSIYENGVLLNSNSKAVNYSSIIVSDKGTIEAWITPQWDSNSAVRHTFFDGPTATRFNCIWYEVSKTWRFGHTAVIASNASTTSFNSGEQHHIAFTWDKAKINATDYIQLYWDGVLIGSVTGNISSVTITGDIYLGRGNAGTYTADMVIDNLKVYNEAKTDFSDRYNEGFGGRKLRR